MIKTLPFSLVIPRFHFKYTFRDFITELTSEFRIIKPDLSALEQYFGGSRLIFTEKGRITIRMALQTLKLKPNSTIGMQPFTCSSVFSAVKKAGHIPLFIDLDDNLRLSTRDLQFKSGRMDALIVTHIFGYPENIDAIRTLIGEKPIIEDCCQALFSEYDGKPVGIKSHAGVFSLGYGKLFGIGSGGFIISNNPHVQSTIDKMVSQLRIPTFPARFKKILKNLYLGLFHNPAIYSLFIYPVKRSFKAETVGLQKYPIVERELPVSSIALFSGRFSHILRLAEQQRENGRLLLSLINNCFSTIKIPEKSNPNYFVIPVLIKDRDLIVEYLAGKGIEAGKHFSDAPHWVRCFGYVEGSCPNFERIAREIFTLPCHYFLSFKEINYIAETLNRFEKGK